MSTATRVFVARIAGLPVFDPNGDLVGRVRDVVVALRIGRDAPRVLGLAVEIQARRRIFVPIGRVNTVDPDAVVLTTGTVSLRRFESRPGETLVLAELLDRRVSLLATGEGATVVDIAMEQMRTGDYLLTRVAVRKGAAGGLRGRRRGEVLQLNWDEVSGFSLPEDGQGAANMLAVFEKLRPADLASVLHDLSGKRRAEVAAALDDERLADVLEEMSEDEQVELIGGLEDERAADVLEAMAPDDAADLLGELPTEEAERLLELMEPEEAGPVRSLLAYSDDTAGGLMTPEPVILPPNATVAEALAMIRNADLSPALAAQVYVVRPPYETPTGRYIGTAHFQRMLREPPSSLISAVVDTDIDPLNPDCPLADVTRHLASYNLVAVPIVDSEQRLLGAVTVDDVLDHVLPQGWRDSRTSRG
ncbi:MAG: MgtE intracellular region [Frankiales bacterium]|jgi:CBS domain-containing protein/sporulation protein YlmC with PRC-barrel domain|nr:MgtE intracellular region [Frankiales bacterium]